MAPTKRRSTDRDLETGVRMLYSAVSGGPISTLRPGPNDKVYDDGLGVYLSISEYRKRHGKYAELRDLVTPTTSIGFS